MRWVMCKCVSSVFQFISQNQTPAGLGANPRFFPFLISIPDLGCKLKNNNSPPWLADTGPGPCEKNLISGGQRKRVWNFSFGIPVTKFGIWNLQEILFETLKPPRTYKVNIGLPYLKYINIYRICIIHESIIFDCGGKIMKMHMSYEWFWYHLN